MNGDLQTIQSQLDRALQRIDRLESHFAEQPHSRWHYLVARPHPWRSQLCLKGRNMTVGQLVSTVVANRLSPEEASVDLDLPIEAIREALAYYEEHKALIQLEAAEERRRLAAKGCPLEPQDLRR